jgi:hypothetical protein
MGWDMKCWAFAVLDVIVANAVKLLFCWARCKLCVTFQMIMQSNEFIYIFSTSLTLRFIL